MAVFPSPQTAIRARDFDVVLITTQYPSTSEDYFFPPKGEGVILSTLRKPR